MNGPQERRAARLGLIALAGLVVVAVPLAAPGAALVPAAKHARPGWLLGIFGQGFGLDGLMYLALLAVAFGCYLALVATARCFGQRVFWAAITCLVTLFVVAPPLLSQDVFSYIAYGRLEARHGLDPYSAVPADRPDDPVVTFVGWRTTPSTYGPVFTLATYPLGLISVAGALWTLKVLAGIAVLALAVITAHIAAVRGGDPQRAAAVVAFNPIVLVHVVGGAHNDALTVLVLMASVAVVVARREILGGAGLVGAAAIKVSGLFAIPFALAGSTRRGRLVAGMAIATVVLAGLAIGAFGSSVGDIAGAIGHNQALSSKYSVPATVSRLSSLPLGFVRGAVLVAYVVTVLYLLRWTLQGGDWVRATGWAAFGLLLTTSWMMPWYVLWLLPFAGVSEDRWLLRATLALCAFQLLNRVPF